LTTAASQAKASLVSMMRHGRWKSEKPVVGYIEDAERFSDNVASIVMQHKK
jgi:hypothetical protein